MLNGLYVKQVSEKFGARIGDLVSDTMEQCEHLVSEGVPYVEATVDIEQSARMSQKMLSGFVLWLFMHSTRGGMTPLSSFWGKILNLQRTVRRN